MPASKSRSVIEREIRLAFAHQSQFTLISISPRKVKATSVVEVQCLRCMEPARRFKFRQMPKKFRTGDCAGCHTKQEREAANALVVQRARENGYDIVSSDYRNQMSAIVFRCKEGHTFSTSYKMVHRDTFSCKVCKLRTPKLRTAFFQDYVKDRSGKILTKVRANWRGDKFKWKIKCSNENHPAFSLTFAHARNRGQWCPRCGAANVGENIIRDIFEFLFQKSFPVSRPEWLHSPHSEKSLELDGYNEKLRIAFEHTGGQRFGKGRGLVRFSANDELKFVQKQFEKVFQCEKRRIELFEFTEIDFRNNLIGIACVIHDRCIAIGRKPVRRPQEYKPNYKAIYGDLRYKALQENILKAENLINAGQVKKRIHLKKIDPKTYDALKYARVLDDVFRRLPNFGRSQLKLSAEDCALEAKKYPTRGDFKDGSSAHYSKARQLKILDKICAHMPKRRAQRPFKILRRIKA